MTLSSRAGIHRFEVPFHDVDTARIVWHGHFYKYFEYARTDLMRRHDLDVDDILALGYGMVVSESRCRHVSPVRYGDQLVVRASFRRVTHQIEVDYSVDNETAGRTAARGRTGLVMVTEELEFLSDIPAEIIACITEESS